MNPGQRFDYFSFCLVLSRFRHWATDTGPESDSEARSEPRFQEGRTLRRELQGLNLKSAAVALEWWAVRLRIFAIIRAETVH